MGRLILFFLFLYIPVDGGIEEELEPVAPPENLVESRTPDGRVQFSGYISYYAETPSVAQIEYFENYHGPHPGYTYIAVPNCDTIGMTGMLYADPLQIPVVVFDCGGAGETTGHNWMLRNLIAAEIDWHSNVRYPTLAHNYATIILDF